MDPTPITTEIVLIGGGHAHVEVLRQFGMRREPGVRISVITREIHTPYSGMLPGLIAGHYTFDDAHIDLAPLAQFAGARLFHDEAIGLDLVTRQVLCRQRPPLSFDLLSIDTGSAPDTAVPGASAHALPVKPVSSFYTRWQALHQRVMDATAPMRIAVVGGGAGGVELLMAVRHRLRTDLIARSEDPERVRFLLVGSGQTVLPSLNRSAQRRYARALAAAGIEVHTDFLVNEVKSDRVSRADGTSIAVDEALWVTTAAAPAWPRAAGLATDDAGFIRVDSSLQAVAWPGIFAAGDIACMDADPRPKSGVFAVRQGSPLAANLRRASRGEPLRPYHPQKHFLSIISTGERHAIATRGQWSVGGRWVWRWKDYIDRRFMRRYSTLPQMDNTTVATDDGSLSDAMRCGGCGAKIGAEVLHEALAALAPPAREDILVGLQQADDAAVVRVPAGHVAVHTVDAFRSFIDDPWMLGRVAAVHGLSDLYAMGATPQSALAMVTLPYGRTTVMRNDLLLVMQGALQVLNAANTILVGGHTGEGAELAVGFALNGYVREDALIRKRGVVAGDVLILTQALGSGVLFAAAMRGKARARSIATALTAMSTLKADAAACLRDAGVHALTDITGFGLVGHLAEMLDDGRHGAELSLAALPLYPDVEALAGHKIVSSLDAENRRAERFVGASAALRASPRYPLAFDPQTAGGLLGAVPANAAPACLAALHARGYRDAAAIGAVTTDAGVIALQD